MEAGRSAAAQLLEAEQQNLAGLEDALRQTAVYAGEGQTEPGGWLELFRQFRTLAAEQHQEIATLQQALERERGELDFFYSELRSTGCEEAEHASVAYSEAEREACRREEARLAVEQKEAEKALSERNAERAKAEAFLEAARNALSEFGGEALAPERIAGAYPERKRKLNLQKKEKQEKAGRNEKTLRESQTMVLLTERLLPAGQKPDAPEQVELERDPGAQWRELEKEYQKQAKALKDGHTNLVRALTGLTGAYQNSAEQNALQSMLELLSHQELSGDLYFTLDERIDQAGHVTELLIGKLQSDLDDFDHARTDLIRQCVLQGQRMYQGLRELEKSARVRLCADRGRTEMLRFDLPQEPDEEAAAAVIAAELETGTRELLERMADPSQEESKVREYAERLVRSERLFRKFIGKEQVLLKAYKIDPNPGAAEYRSWEQTQINNSGAERFLVYFSVILALMNYTGGTDGTRDGTGVLILDNPFGVITSRHVLEPMFRIAKHFRIQLICLSDI